MQAKSELGVAIMKSLAGKYALYVFQILSLAILARLFTPETFGIIAAAQIFVMLFQMLATSGLAPAIVYQETISKALKNGVFSFSVLLGGGLAIVFLFIAEPIFNWFEFDQGLIVFYVLAPCVFFSSLCMVPVALLQKDARFISISSAELFAEIIALVACIVASFYTEALIALSLKFLLVPVFRFVFYYWFSSYSSSGRPSLGRQISQVRVLYDYAKYQIAFNIVNYVATNADNLLIAKYFGAASLGVYEKTYQLMRYPLQLFTFAITPALQPILTKYKHEPSIVYNAYFDVAFKLALVGIFSATVMYWNAHNIIYILFGDQWFGAVPFLQILAVSIPVQMVLSSTGGVYQAFGNTKAMFWCGIFSATLTTSAIITGIVQDSIEFMCLMLVLAYSINFLQCFYVMFKTVFVNQAIYKFIVLAILVGLGVINLLFKPQALTENISIVGSIIDIAITSVIVSVPLLLLFLLLRKLK